jgi:chemotaxis protein MotA
VRIMTLFAIFLGVGVFVVAAVTSAKNPAIFLNAHAALVVLGGTFSAAAISFGFDRLYILTKVLTRRILKGKRNFKPQKMIEQIMYLAEVYRSRPELLRNETSKISDPFLRECIELIVDGYYEPDDLLKLLMRRTTSVYRHYNEEALKFKALAKFPPAFGLMGAVLGMIGIMSELGTTGSASTVGPGLALALVGTLYGVALANLVILPLSENLQDSAREIRAKNLMITEAIHLLLQKKNPIIMAEDLNSFLLANERLDWKKTKRKVHEAA